LSRPPGGAFSGPAERRSDETRDHGRRSGRRDDATCGISSMSSAAIAGNQNPLSHLCHNQGMKIPGFIWLLLALAAVVLAAGIPYWRLSYDEINRGHFAILPGALLLGFLTLVLVAAEVARVKQIAVTMLFCVPAIDIVSIVKDTAADPTSHNLWPLEFAIAAISGALVVVPAVLAGLAARWAMAKMAAG
jgi:hypothetical protein